MMHSDWFELLSGLFLGGVGLSAGWGLFWLTIGAIGLVRRTCRWSVVLHSLAVFVTPLVLASVLIWLRWAMPSPRSIFWIGVLSMPMVLVGLGLRSAPDGRRAGLHMLEGIRHVMDDLLGKHRECSGCGHDHGSHKSEGCA